jgi:tol-pal system protein YbgF
MFSQFQNRYPRHDLAVKADNWIRYIEKQQAAHTPEPAYKAGPVYKPETAYTPKEKAVTSRPKPAPEPPEKKAPPAPAYTGKMVEDLYNEALNAYYNQGIDESIRLFRKLSQTYPDHELAEKAKGWITYINKNRPEKTDEKTTEKRQKRQIPKTAEVKSHYDEALKKFYREDYDEAFSMFMSIVDERPNHSLADNALYWAGECLYGKKDYYESAMLFRDLVEKYPEGNKVPDALLKAGLSYLSLSDPENAGYYLNRVIEEYPGTSAASKAVTYLEKVDSIRPETSPYPGSDDLDMQVQAKASFKGKSRGYKNPAPRTKPWHLGTIRLRTSKL